MESEDVSKESDSSNELIDLILPNDFNNSNNQNINNNNSSIMGKRQSQAHHYLLLRRRWIILGASFLLLIGVMILRSNESAMVGFVDNYQIIESKTGEKKIVVSDPPQKTSWLWPAKRAKVELSTNGGEPPVTQASTRYSVPLHAAEALQCRESVVSFVINATDGKDECVGLQKAFDQTCGVGAAVGSAGVTASVGDRRLQRRKKVRWAQNVLYSAYYYRKWRVWMYRMSRWTCTSVAWIGNYLTTGESSMSDAFFFAEDEIVESWSQAEYLVENNLDRYAYMDIIESWQKKRAALARRRLQEDGDTANNVTTSGNRSHYTLDLPTAQKHASEHVVDQTLSLHQGEDLADGTANKTSDSSTGKNNDPDKNAKTLQPVAVYDPMELRKCCASILNVYHENCSQDDEETISDSRLFFVVCVMAACGTVKSLIRFYKLLWLPEAAGCILVGVASGYIVMFFPHHDLSFDGHWFLRIMVPPIIFEAALSIDKRSFNRHVVPILFYAIGGTLMATFLTAFIVHQGSHMLSSVCTPLPYVESLTFGALISSIDPIAVLSVLSNMGMTDMDTIYVLIFGESLLNDGVAIVLFETLVRFLDDSIIIDSDEIAAAAVHFSVVAFGSLLVGVGAGMLSTVYFWIFRGCQTPLVEVLMFFCWALLPYYVCDGIEWSGIVCAVATGFVMDVHIVGQRTEEAAIADASERTDAADRPSSGKSFANRRERRKIFNSPNGQLSEESRTHIGFVAEIISTTMETAIFAYLGLFLFSHRYHWNVWHSLIAIFACGASRAFMIPTMSFFANWITKIRQATQSCMPSAASAALSNCNRTASNGSSATPTPGQPGVIVDKKMQLVLWFAGLRGAMSFALVEHIPLYDSSSGEGTPLKPELKAMTSASILFTVFVLGGYTFYVMEHLGLSPSNSTSSKRTSNAEAFLPLLPSISTSTLSNESPIGDKKQTFEEDEDDRSLTSPRARRRQPLTRQPVARHRSHSPARLMEMAKNNL